MTGYLFVTDNLGFRPVIRTDLDYLLMLDSDPDVMSFFPGGAQSREDIAKKIKKYQTDYSQYGYGALLVFESDSDKFIGRAGFSDLETGETEVGYLVMKKYWGKGYATRILRALLQWAKNNIYKDKIIALTPIDHIASERVMQKAGMVFVRKDHLKGVDCVVYEYKYTK